MCNPYRLNLFLKRCEESYPCGHSVKFIKNGKFIRQGWLGDKIYNYLFESNLLDSNPKYRHFLCYAPRPSVGTKSAEI